MLFQRDLYAKYQALSPIYQGYKTNQLPVLYTMLRTLTLERNIIEVALDSYKQQVDLYELTDVTYPKTEQEEDYIGRTNLYLTELYRDGMDVVIGRYLDVFSDRLESMKYQGFVRLAFAKQSQDDILVAQALAYLDVFGISMEIPYHQSSTTIQSPFESARNTKMDDTEQSALPVMDRFVELIQQRGIRDELNVAYDKDEWLTVLLNRYLATSSPLILHAIVAFYAFTVLEELMVDATEWVHRWIAASQLFARLDDTTIPVVQERLFPWDLMLGNLHLMGDADRMIALYALSELNQRYHLAECQSIASHLYIG